MRITDGNGSVEPTGLGASAKKASAAAADPTKAAASADRAAKKAELDATAGAELVKWRHAKPACTCQPAALAPARRSLPRGWLASLFILRYPKKRQCGAKAPKEATSAVEPPSEGECELQAEAGSGLGKAFEEEGE